MLAQREQVHEVGDTGSEAGAVLAIQMHFAGNGRRPIFVHVSVVRKRNRHPKSQIVANQVGKIGNQGRAFFIGPAVKLPFLYFELYRMENFKAVLGLEPGELYVKPPPLIGVAYKRCQNDRWRGAVGIGLVKVSRENHEQALRDPAMVKLAKMGAGSGEPSSPRYANESAPGGAPGAIYIIVAASPHELGTHRPHNSAWPLESLSADRADA
jgi:hypothetical protein